MIVVFSQPFSTTPVFLALRSPLHRLAWTPHKFHWKCPSWDIVTSVRAAEHPWPLSKLPPLCVKLVKPCSFCYASTWQKTGLYAASFPMTALMKRIACSLLCNDCTDEKNNNLCVTSFPMTALMNRRTVCDLLSNDCIDEKKNGLCVTSFPLTALMKRTVCNLLSNDCIDEKENCVWPPFQWLHWWKEEPAVRYLLSNDHIDEKKNGLCAASFPMTTLMNHQNTSLALSVMFFLVTKVHRCLHRSARPILHSSQVCAAQVCSNMPTAPKTLFTQFAAWEKNPLPFIKPPR